MEDDGDWLCAERRTSALDRWLELLVDLQRVEDGCEVLLRLQQSGGRHLWMRKQCPSQCWRSDIEARDWGPSEYFMTPTCSERSSSLLCPGLQARLFYLKKKRDDLDRSFHLEEFWITSNHVFVGRGYLQHTGPTWNGHQALWYHIDIKPYNNNLKEAVVLAYGCSLRPMML